MLWYEKYTRHRKRTCAHSQEGCTRSQWTETQWNGGYQRVRVGRLRRCFGKNHNISITGETSVGISCIVVTTAKKQALIARYVVYKRKWEGTGLKWIILKSSEVLQHRLGLWGRGSSLGLRGRGSTPVQICPSRTSVFLLFPSLLLKTIPPHLKSWRRANVKGWRISLPAL